MAASIMNVLETGIVPIIENKQSRRLVGVVTDRDLCLGMLARSK
jgi:CBS domain-containing protein